MRTVVKPDFTEKEKGWSSKPLPRNSILIPFNPPKMTVKVTRKPKQWFDGAFVEVTFDKALLFRGRSRFLRCCGLHFQRILVSKI